VNFIGLVELVNEEALVDSGSVVEKGDGSRPNVDLWVVDEDVAEEHVEGLVGEGVGAGVVPEFLLEVELDRLAAVVVEGGLRKEDLGVEFGHVLLNNLLVREAVLWAAPLYRDLKGRYVGRVPAMHRHVQLGRVADQNVGQLVRF
jgi:hypothetical protein